MTGVRFLFRVTLRRHDLAAARATGRGTHGWDGWQLLNKIPNK
jgi:hypothetical protein